MTQLKKFIPKPPQAPLHGSTGVLGIIRTKIFPTPLQGLISLVVIALLFYIFQVSFNWGVWDAVWDAQNRRECLTKSPNGACWAGVIRWFNSLMYGRYPGEMQWRVNLGFISLLLWLVPLTFKQVKNKFFIALSSMFLFPFYANYLFLGGTHGFMSTLLASLGCGVLILILINFVRALVHKLPLESLIHYKIANIFHTKSLLVSYVLIMSAFAILGYLILFRYLNLPYVGIERWGGLFLTFIIAGTAIATSIPIGTMLALGRRSKMRVISMLCVGVIELVRSAPLITVLFMALTLMPLFLPNDLELNKLIQALVAVCIFSGAYMAETIRGGLQAIPKGQMEACQSLGMGYWMSMGLVVLPQALKLMIPNIVTSFASLLKDTTLVSIIGLSDIMQMSKNIAVDKNWLGMHTEPMVFISIIFFVLCFGMSEYSQRLEKKLNGNVRS